MTAFQWTTTPQAPDTGCVFGTELPKLVVNEVYLQYDNDPTDPFPKNGMGVKTASKPYQMNVYAELVNPLPSGADLNGSNQATLVNSAGSPLYQIVLSKTNSQASAYGGTFPTGMRRPEHDRRRPGQQQPALHRSRQLQQPRTGAFGRRQPGGRPADRDADGDDSATDATHTNQGFYVLGPQLGRHRFAGQLRTPTDASFKTTMAYAVNYNDPMRTTATTLRADGPPAAAGQPEPALSAERRGRRLQPVRHRRLRRHERGRRRPATVINDARTYNANGELPVPPAVRSAGFPSAATSPTRRATRGAAVRNWQAAALITRYRQQPAERHLLQP